MKLELFFDYICPYCYRGHRMFLELLPLYPGLEVVWRPCESHPRPENTYRHSDMAIQGGARRRSLLLSPAGVRGAL